MFRIALTLLTASMAQQGLDLIAKDLPCQVMASYTSLGKCYAKKCAGSVVISDDINFNNGDMVPVDNVDDFAFLPVSNCTFQAENKIFTYSSYSGIVDITIALRGQKLVGFDSGNLYYARPDNVQFVSYNMASMEPVAVKSLDGQRMSFGNWNAVCTFDAKNSNKCILNGKTYDMGGMCAHKLLVIGGYAVMTCSKNFPPETVRKVRIVKISDGTLIGEVGVPWMDGYISSPEHDSVAAVKTKSGVQVFLSVLGVGFMMEVVEQGTMVGYRSTINSFNTCSGAGTAFSDGSQIFVQSSSRLFGVQQPKPLDCAKSFEDYSFDQFKQTAICNNPTSFRNGKITKTETFDILVNKSPNCLKSAESRDIQDMKVTRKKKKGPKQNDDESDSGQDDVYEYEPSEDEIHSKHNEAPSESDLNWAIMQEYPGLNDPQYWYYRDIPLSTTNNEKTADFWIDMQVLEFDLELCFERGMNCTSTCCKQTYCAAIQGDCIHYIHNNYMELYTCVIVILSIVIGIPACVRSMEFILIYKFCKVYNEDENAYTGGTTILEGLYKCFSSKKAPTEGTVVVEADVDDEYAKKEASKNKPEPKREEGKVATCCKACLCCITKNTVSLETEMALNSRHSNDDHTASMGETKHSRVQFADMDLKNDVEGDLDNFNQDAVDEEETEHIQDYYSDDY